METSSANSVASSTMLSEPRMRRQQNAMARRKLQDLHDEKVLQFWMAEVWDQTAQEVGDMGLGNTSSLW